MLLVTLVNFVLSSTSEKLIFEELITKNIVTIRNLTTNLKVMGDIDTVLAEEIYGDKVNFEYLADKSTMIFMSFDLDGAEISIVKPRGYCLVNAYLKNEEIKRKTYHNCTRVSTEYELSNGLEVNFTNPNAFNCTLNVNNSDWIIKSMPGNKFTLKVVENEKNLALRFTGVKIFREIDDEENSNGEITDDLEFRIDEESKITLLFRLF